MKVDINEKGAMIIRATNSLESYALRKWFDDYTNEKTATLSIETFEIACEIKNVPAVRETKVA